MDMKANYHNNFDSFRQQITKREHAAKKESAHNIDLSFDFAFSSIDQYKEEIL